MRTGVVQRPKDKILSMDPKEITYEMVQKKLQEIAMARGKTTRIDRQEQARGWGLGGASRGCSSMSRTGASVHAACVGAAAPGSETSSLLDGCPPAHLPTRPPHRLQIEMLTYLSGVTKGPVQKVEVMINIITVTFDMNQPTQVRRGAGARVEGSVAVAAWRLLHASCWRCLTSPTRSPAPRRRAR